MKNNTLTISAKLKIIVALILVPGVRGSGLHAQGIYKVDPSSKMVIEGTSTLHDWTSTITQVQGQARINFDNNKIEGLGSLNMIIPVESIQSDHSLMNSKTYEALKKDQFPVIKFDLQKIEKLDAGKVDAAGQLTIAGVTQDVNLEVSYKQLPGNKVMFSGEKSIKMSDFRITPPTAFMGSIKTGDTIMVKFETVFEH